MQAHQGSLNYFSKVILQTKKEMTDQAGSPCMLHAAVALVGEYRAEPGEYRAVCLGNTGLSLGNTGPCAWGIQG